MQRQLATAATTRVEVAWSVCLCVYVLVMFISPAKMADAIQMLLGRLTWVDPRNHVLDRSRDPPLGTDFWKLSTPLKKISPVWD